MSGYILDDFALIAGLTTAGSEHHRRELSRLLHGAIDGGPALDVPALCLTAAALVRAPIAEHLAEIIATAPAGTITVSGLTRTAQLDVLRGLYPSLGWPALHTTAYALASGLPILTVDTGRYAKVGVNTLAL